MLGYFSRNFFCQLEVKCKNCTKTSLTKANSIKDGFYLMDYKPLQKEIKLMNYPGKIEFKNAWVENQWFYNSNDCINTKQEKRDGYNVIFEFKESNIHSFIFSLTPVINGRIDETNGGIKADRKEIRLKTLSDTIWLRVFERNPIDSIGWQQEIEGELIGFVKK
jgi:hypothetical protein